MQEDFDDKLEIESGKNIWIADGPIGRFRFFVIQMGVLLTGFVVLFFKNVIIPSIPHCPVDALKLLVLIVAIMLWVCYVAIAKRIYDITGSLKKGILFSVLLFILTLFFKIIISIVTIALFFIPGKMIKSNY